MDILRALEKLPTDGEDRPRVPVFIVGCGASKRSAIRKQLDSEEKESSAAKGKKILRMLLHGDKTMEEKIEAGPDESPPHSDSMVAAVRDSPPDRLLTSEPAAESANDSHLRETENTAEPSEKSDKEGEERAFGVDPQAAQQADDLNENQKDESDDDESDDYEARSRMLLGPTPSAATEGDEESARLSRLQSRLRQSNYLNSKAIADEANHAEARQQAQLLKTSRKPAGWSDDPKWFLQESAAQVESKNTAKDRKKRDIVYDWNVANARSVYKVQEKSIHAGNVNDLEYEKQKKRLGEAAFYESHKSVIPVEHVPSSSAKAKLAALVTPQKKRRQRFDIELGDITYINERNKKYNRKLEKSFGAYTIETKQNLERGTAL
eukprot:Protomagalhaensia_wolfi_Nauph_80__297@NODE_1166_length_1686_cov_8_079539_g890_i0_p1_GENE_NODE_1166_length_1686_cov_8_079539_g890_i0NODE_1166_length_1686_cov_8_079539_g890_i0_p1_ORF_typecomplete_len379_score72_54SYF2/PF08231_12/1_8e04SYF2/PF08231_12/1_1e22_NODE_1166_length_1686_cov_8_079539_g890_i04511587